MATYERTGDFFGEPEKAKTPQLYPLCGVPESAAASVPCTRATAETGVTYISDGTRFYYLSAIQELFNNEIVAWQISERNDVKLVLNTLERWTRKRDVSRAVLHSVMLPVYVSGVQHTTRRIQRQGQSLSQSYLSG
ncbi:hypothetical protein Q0V21_05180 [Paenibacillus sp. 11B]|uniref:hypothetical protein n=1 Tax=Paenibacillus sp. 11B TaxID=3060965 RepID=UPI0026506404|nr:hypothetical protein [Paenibacillus sp. 11B]MDN8588159.1 hypothetical protein [Paenibacillus sp. 11B]